MVTRTERTTVVGVFRDVDQARDAIMALKDAGFDADRIGVLAPDRDRGRDLAEETGTKAGEGAATGALTGGVLGGLAGWLVGIGALAIPGVGPFIAGGALAAALGGAAIGAGVGAVAGALIGMGVPEEEARYYEEEVRGGRTLVTVRADGRYDEARAILRRHGAYDVEDRAPATAGAERERTVPLREEELQARKRPVEAGAVEIEKDVVTEQRTMDVPVTREEVIVERHPVERRPADRPVGEREEIEVPLREERVEVEKRPVVYEEVEVGKRPVTETERVAGTVRREVAEVETEGDVDIDRGRRR